VPHHPMESAEGNTWGCRGGVTVEVRKNPKSTTWYNATILDINGDKILVGFEDSIWQNREVPSLSVRRCPLEIEGDDFDPQIDDMVEVMVSASDINPSGWSQGRVKTITNSFYFISFTGNHKGTQELIVEKKALRRLNGQSPIDTQLLIRKTIPVEKELHSWVRSQDSLGCLSHVQNKGKLLVASCINMEPDAAEPPQVLLVGDEHAVDLGEKLLVLIHFKNQLEMQRFHDQREVLIQRLAERQKWFADQFEEVFELEQSLVGKLIGKNGANTT